MASLEGEFGEDHGSFQAAHLGGDDMNRRYLVLGLLLLVAGMGCVGDEQTVAQEKVAREMIVVQVQPVSWQDLAPEGLNRRIAAADAADTAWPASPLQIAVHLFGGDQEAQVVTLTAAKNRAESADSTSISYRREGLLDDAVRGVWHEAQLGRQTDGTWRIVRARVAFWCRHSADAAGYQADPCP
jgi:hypothetical protein